MKEEILGFLFANKMEFNFYSDIKKKLSLIKVIYLKKSSCGLINIQRLYSRITDKTLKDAFQLTASTNVT